MFVRPSSEREHAEDLDLGAGFHRHAATRARFGAKAVVRGAIKRTVTVPGTVKREAAERRLSRRAARPGAFDLRQRLLDGLSVADPAEPRVARFSVSARWTGAAGRRDGTISSVLLAPRTRVPACAITSLYGSQMSAGPQLHRGVSHQLPTGCQAVLSSISGSIRVSESVCGAGRDTRLTVSAASSSIVAATASS
jgi:hypothetical protein